MSVKNIIVKEAKVVEKEGKEWIELIDQENKTHRVFKSIQNNEGEWIHLDNEVDMLKAKIEDRSIIGIALELVKEQKGTYWNVIGVKLIEDVFKQKALTEVTDEQAEIKNKSVTLSYAKDLAMAGKIDIALICAYAETFYRYIKGKSGITFLEEDNKETIKEVAPEKITPEEEPAFENVGQLLTWASKQGLSMKRISAIMNAYRTENNLPPIKSTAEIKALNPELTDDANIITAYKLLLAELNN